jgi:hypothetical protein
VSPMPEREALLLPGPRAALLDRLGTLTVEEMHALDGAVRALRTEQAYRGRVDRGFWLAWQAGPRLTKVEGVELEDLFTEVVVAIAGGLTGLEAERITASSGDPQQEGVLGDLARLFLPASIGRSRPDAAIRLIDRAVAPWDPHLAIVACWNVACAATLRHHLAAGLVGVLEVAWRTALGEPPA